MLQLSNLDQAIGDNYATKKGLATNFYSFICLGMTMF